MKREFPAKLFAVMVYGARFLASLGVPERIPLMLLSTMPGGRVGETA
jgi:hypothetical protein